ncbi:MULTISPECIES: DUF1036 domain-containing protein [unclassified Synechocystis]|uniref:DUF1036 domain-containing protein n=1 Tax=unclassified Synechocystis TaxID=2640012 RepID=UPI00041EE668|nr:MULTISPECIES: DUF1036 domain-containing protein [unclassified Synechocystis]AIE72569.1 hypothetical protein D082_00400 [Synechocystis sp. PCC 6714]MCT0254489.1 DUF1036 domain-containing protein [Synechocystis sp. CS-94]
MVSKGLLSATVMALGTALVGAIFTPAPALAGKSCNYLNTNLSMAQGYENQNGVWVSEGWWVLEPGECVVYSDNAFTYFKIRDGVAPNRKAMEEMAGSESIKLCQVNDRFTVFQSDNGSVCRDAGGNTQVFTNPGTNLELIRSTGRF